MDTPAWDETVVIGYTCSVCGLTKSADQSAAGQPVTEQSATGQPRATGETVPITEMDGSTTLCPVYLDADGKKYYVYLGYEVYMHD